MNVYISNELVKTLGYFKVIAYTFDCENPLQKSKEVDSLLAALKDEETITIDQVLQDTTLLETRNAYKKLHKDPSHTRPACEALLRRVLKNGELYRLGDAIDLGNILSVKARRSVCVASLNEIKGDIFIRKGTKEDSFEGINRGIINAENLILYTDREGVFGSLTSDTIRTKVKDTTTKLLVLVDLFSKNKEEENEQLLLKLFQENLKIKNINKLEVTYYDE